MEWSREWLRCTSAGGRCTNGGELGKPSAAELVPVQRKARCKRSEATQRKTHGERGDAERGTPPPSPGKGGVPPPGAWGGESSGKVTQSASHEFTNLQQYLILHYYFSVS